MARKRGGLAGLWDKNKRIIKPIAAGLAGFVGTPALGALVGAAMGGFDREGKGGIGFDAKQGALGGLSGYAAGSLGSTLGATGIGQSLGGGSLAGLNSTAGAGAKGQLADLFMGKGAAAPIANSVSTAGMAGQPPALMDVANAGKAMTGGQLDDAALQAAGRHAGGMFSPGPLANSMGRMPASGMPSAINTATGSPSLGALGQANRIPLQSGVIGDVASGAARRSAMNTAAGASPQPSLMGSLGKKLTGAANWADAHPTAMKAGEGLVKGMMPASGLERAKEAETDAQRRLLELELMQRQGAMAGNTAQRNALSAQLAALMAGSRAPALSLYGR